MELVADELLRIKALELALGWIVDVGGTPEHIIKIANMFHEFLAAGDQ